MLSDVNSNTSGLRIARESEGMRARYGLMQATYGGEESKLAFGDPDKVENPRKGMQFDV